MFSVVPTTDAAYETGIETEKMLGFSNPMLGRRRSSILELIKVVADGELKRASIDYATVADMHSMSMVASVALAQRRKSSFSTLLDTLFKDQEKDHDPFDPTAALGMLTGNDAGEDSCSAVVPQMPIKEEDEHDTHTHTSGTAPVSLEAWGSEEILQLSTSDAESDSDSGFRSPSDAITLATRSASRSSSAPATMAGKRKAGKRPKAVRLPTAVRALMPRVEKRGRSNPMLQAATKGMGPANARLEKNRLSARECRIRKKEYLSNLEREVVANAEREATYLSEIALLTAQVERLQEQLQERP